MAQSDLRSRIVLEGADKAVADLKKLGDAGENSLNKVSRAADKSAISFKELSGATTATARSFATLRSSLSGLSAGFTSFIEGASKFKSALTGLVAIEGLRQGIDKVSDSLQKFRDIRNAALGTGLDLNTVKAFDLAMAKSGLRGEKSAGALIQFAGAAGDALAKVKAANKELDGSSERFKLVGDATSAAADKVNVLRGSVGGSGGLVQVFRGMKAPLDETRDVFASLRIDVDQFRDGVGRLNIDKLLEATVKRLQQVIKTQPALGARAGALLFGEDDIVKLSKALEILASQFNQLKSQAQNLPPTVQDLKNLDKYDQALANLKLRWDAIWSAIALASLESDRLMVIGADRLLQGFEFVFSELKRGFGEIASGLGDAFTLAFNNVWASAKSLFDWLWAQVQSIGSAVGSVFSSAPAATAPIPPAGKFATGGQVPGSGSGDTVPAWLTPGEFVMRRSVVSELGAPFFAMLNRGMGSHLPRTRFATGGMVAAGAAGGGTPVHLHLGGHSFALSGAENVVGALVVEANRHKMRATGTKPSWYGGTPGGR